MHTLLLVATLAGLASACGKSGPPLPPLHLIPEPPASVVARRAGQEVRFTFVLPRKNVNGPGAVDMDRVEIYGATIAAGAVTPSNRELMTSKNLVGTIAVRVPPKDEPPAEKPDDKRPGPGETVTFVEVLDEAKLKPTYTQVAPVAPAPATPVPVAPPATTPTAPALPKRVYAIAGIARGGRPGQPAPRIELPLDELPPAPADVAVKFTATAITLAWTPPAAAGGAAATGFNVYQADGVTPLNPSPLGAPSFERQGIEFGKEECFVVRTVKAAVNVSIESLPSPRACVTPTDIFPPAAPKGLSAAPGSGFISLIWDANTEPDLAGYVVLRGEAPGDKLQPLTPSPIKETTFRDTTVQPGVRYVYAIVAVDTAIPSNASAQSARVEETAR